ncbi:MAG: hypothetical protein WAK12_02070 [Acidimicrobiales bacterium]
MQYSRQHVIDMLSKAGFHKAADEAADELPDPVDLDQVQDWAMKRGITRDALISWMGGSP